MGRTTTPTRRLEHLVRLRQRTLAVFMRAALLQRAFPVLLALGRSVGNDRVDRDSHGAAAIQRDACDRHSDEAGRDAKQECTAHCRMGEDVAELQAGKLRVEARQPELRRPRGGPKQPHDKHPGDGVAQPGMDQPQLAAGIAGDDEDREQRVIRPKTVQYGQGNLPGDWASPAGRLTALICMSEKSATPCSGSRRRPVVST
jgi:hypothetical protein